MSEATADVLNLTQRDFARCCRIRESCGLDMKNLYVDGGEVRRREERSDEL